VGITLVVEVEGETLKILLPLVITRMTKGRRVLHQRSSKKKKKLQGLHTLTYHRVHVLGPMDVWRLLF
jgi:hypothetical protein